MSASTSVPPGENRMAAICVDLMEKGWSWQPDLLPETIRDGLAADIRLLAKSDGLSPAGIGRAGHFLLDTSVRKTQITWIEGDTPAQSAFLDWAALLKDGLNRKLLLGLFEFESCFAVYPAGGFYDRHLDSFVGQRNRIVSFVTYLSEDWTDENGGHLAIWPENAADTDAPIARLKPNFGDAVFMLSEVIPHAVEVTHAQRLGIAGWWRLKPSNPLLSAEAL